MGQRDYLGRARRKIQRLVAPNLVKELTELRTRAEANERDTAMLVARMRSFDLNALDESRNLVDSAPIALRSMKRPRTGDVVAAGPSTRPLVSVIIPTLNRARSLKVALDSLQFQQHVCFEVIVVNGPSTDDSAQVAADREGVRVVNCPAANVSMARNLGIEQSLGNMIAFLDDDAIPEFNWLADLVAAMDGCDGVGGLVLDHTGLQFQSRFLAVTRLGETLRRADQSCENLGFPLSFCVPYLPGGNSLFRRSVLEAVGGFDETYQYYHDDSDLSVRLVDHGYVLRQIVGGVIHHHSAPSAIRNPQQRLTDVVPIVRSATYFSYRHGQPFATAAKLAETTDLVRNHFAAMAIDNLGPAAADNVLAQSHAASSAGFEAAQHPAQLREFSPRDQTGIFAAVPTTSLLAPAIVIAESPDDVERSRVLSTTRETRVLLASDLDCLELSGGLWLHHLPELTPSAIVAELTRISEWVDDAVVVARHGANHQLDALNEVLSVATTAAAAQNVPETEWLTLGILVRTGTRRQD